MNKIEKHKKICEELNFLYSEKNHDYGDAFAKVFNELGEISAYTRMYDKLFRLISLMQKDQKIVSESKIDTLKDLANYAIMTIIELGGKK